MSIAPVLEHDLAPRRPGPSPVDRAGNPVRRVGSDEHADRLPPLLRQVPLPRTEPSFDDETAGRGAVPEAVARYGQVSPEAVARYGQVSPEVRGRADGSRQQTAPASRRPVSPHPLVDRPAGRPAGRTGTGAHPGAPTLRLLPGGRSEPAAPGTAPTLRGTSGDPDTRSATGLVGGTAPAVEVRAAPVEREGLDAPASGPDEAGLVAVRVVALVATPEAPVPDEPQTRRLDQLPDPRPLAGQLAQAVVEVLSGDRPITQLLTWLNEQIYLELATLAPTPATVPTVGRARVVTIRPQDRPKIRSVHVCQPAAGVAEIAARVQTNGRSRAVAMRLEEWRGRWRCSALVIG